MLGKKGVESRIQELAKSQTSEGKDGRMPVDSGVVVDLAPGSPGNSTKALLLIVKLRD